MTEYNFVKSTNKIEKERKIQFTEDNEKRNKEKIEGTGGLDYSSIKNSKNYFAISDFYDEINFEKIEDSTANNEFKERKSIDIDELMNKQENFEESFLNVLFKLKKENNTSPHKPLKNNSQQNITKYKNPHMPKMNTEINGNGNANFENLSSSNLEDSKNYIKEFIEIYNQNEKGIKQKKEKKENNNGFGFDLEEIKNKNSSNIGFDLNSRLKHLKFGENIIKTKVLTQEEKQEIGIEVNIVKEKKKKLLKSYIPKVRSITKNESIKKNSNEKEMFSNKGNEVNKERKVVKRRKHEKVVQELEVDLENIDLENQMTLRREKQLKDKKSKKSKSLNRDLAKNTKYSNSNRRNENKEIIINENTKQTKQINSLKKPALIKINLENKNENEHKLKSNEKKSSVKKTFQVEIDLFNIDVNYKKSKKLRNSKCFSFNLDSNLNNIKLKSEELNEFLNNLKTLVEIDKEVFNSNKLQKGKYKSIAFFESAKYFLQVSKISSVILNELKEANKINSKNKKKKENEVRSKKDKSLINRLNKTHKENKERSKSSLGLFGFKLKQNEKNKLNNETTIKKIKKDNPSKAFLNLLESSFNYKKPKTPKSENKAKNKLPSFKLNERLYKKKSLQTIKPEKIELEKVEENKNSSKPKKLLIVTYKRKIKKDSVNKTNSRVVARSSSSLNNNSNFANQLRKINSTILKTEYNKSFKAKKNNFSVFSHKVNSSLATTTNKTKLLSLSQSVSMKYNQKNEKKVKKEMKEIREIFGYKPTNTKRQELLKYSQSVNSNDNGLIGIGLGNEKKKIRHLSPISNYSNFTYSKNKGIKARSKQKVDGKQTFIFSKIKNNSKFNSKMNSYFNKKQDNDARSKKQNRRRIYTEEKRSFQYKSLNNGSFNSWVLSNTNTSYNSNIIQNPSNKYKVKTEYYKKLMSVESRYNKFSLNVNKEINNLFKTKI